MSEPLKKTPKKKPSTKRVDPELPDDDSIRRLFPKKVVDDVNRKIDHKPKTPKK